MRGALAGLRLLKANKTSGQACRCILPRERTFAPPSEATLWRGVPAACSGPQITGGDFPTRFYSTKVNNSDRTGSVGTEESGSQPQTLELAHTLYERSSDAADTSPVTLLHGLFGRKENLTKEGKTLNHLTRRSVILPDLRNHGDSPRSQHMSFKHMSDDVVRLWDSLKVKKSSLMGFGMGGRVAMHTALTRPDSVDKLVVVSSSPINIKEARDDKIVQACYIMKTLTNKQEDVNSAVFKLDADIALKTVIPSEKERALLISNAAGVNLDAILSSSGLCHFPSLEKKVFENQVLFITGEKETLWKSDSDKAKIRAYFPNSTFIEVPKAGYYVQLEATEKFLEEVTSFLHH